MRNLVGDAVAGTQQTIATLNGAAMRGVCEYLSITTPILVASALDLDLPDQCAAGEWAFHITKQLGGSEYRNAAGGRKVFDPALFEANGIRLSFHEHRPLHYTTGSFAFVENLSIIDWMMWNSRDQLRGWLGSYSAS